MAIMHHTVILIVPWQPSGPLHYSLLTTSHIHVPMVTDTKEEILKFCFDTFDADGSGAIDEEEFMRTSSYTIWERNVIRSLLIVVLVGLCRSCLHC